MEGREKEIKGWFEQCNAIWVHDGDPKSPHAELTSGKCSNAYFNCPEVLKKPMFNLALAERLVVELRKNRIDIVEDKIDWVIGSPYSAITFSYEVAKLLNAIHGFTEKEQKPGSKKMLWQRMTIPEGSKVLQIEELITTSQTFVNVRQAVEEGNKYPVNFLDEVGVIVHRPPKLPADYGDRKIVSLIEQEVWAVEPEDCKLCKKGSPRFKPKSHWAELTGKS
ncbi:MAG: hypothetical protein ABII95_03150 [Patescibacteria group bacterium]|nr:hypothetical protein [Patescibacteria group bacterium]MBU2068559.1 hypothetical protein [Patescibacteria group bacterium]